MSVADTLRLEQRAAVQPMSPEARILLAFRLGQRDVALYAAAHGVSPVEARRALAKQRGTGRVRSVSASR
ncbi:MAG TPA: hypothetical protein VF331_26190 [Polyangiales bacterium]